MKPVTAWYRMDKKYGGMYLFNHIEDGHSPGDKPKDPFNRGWSSAKWFKRYGYLKESVLCIEPIGGLQVVPVSAPRKD